MAQLQAVRGTQDLLPADARRHRTVSDTARLIAARYGFAEIATPIFEFTEVFARPIGEATDVVSKEMYTFTDRGGEEITLRPEGTAAVVRAIIANGLTQSAPLKYFYSGPMFRYERPQKGRSRQFHQIGAELVGPSQPQADIELIALCRRIFEALGIASLCTLELNTLGDLPSRQAYRAALVDHFRAHEAELSADSRDRLTRNPLRILDSKAPEDRVLIDAAPSFAPYLNDESRRFFDAVQEGLAALDIAFILNPRLVRGLDYYTHTAFEFTTTALGAQGTLGGGGRYDGLMSTLGGPNLPGVGWACGIERIAMLIAEPPAGTRPVVIVPVGPVAERTALQLTERLRGDGFTVELGYSGNVAKRMKYANKVHACVALLLGDDELARQVVTFRDLDQGEQREIAMTDLAAALEAYR